jgi:hypothetical protein
MRKIKRIVIGDVFPKVEKLSRKIKKNKLTQECDLKLCRKLYFVLDGVFADEVCIAVREMAREKQK